MLRSPADVVAGLGNSLWITSLETTKVYAADGYRSGRLNDRSPDYHHEGVYMDLPCDADVLAGCVGEATAVVSFFDLDEASFDSFRRFKGEKIRLLLFYSPSIVDRHFVAAGGSWNMTWLSNEESMVEPVVGRVDCLQTPTLCDDMDPSSGPRVHVAYPRSFDFSKMREMYFEGAFEKRMKEYGEGVSQCLWTRLGAGALTSGCGFALKQYESTLAMQIDELGDSIAIKGFIQDGRRVAFMWNVLVVLACLSLLAALGLAGWKMIRKCLARWCGDQIGIVVRNSASMTREERKAQLRLQIYWFYFAAFTIGCINVVYPAVILMLGGPISVGTLAWLWYAEFKCSSPCYRRRERSKAVPPNENQVDLLSDEEAH